MNRKMKFYIISFALAIALTVNSLAAYMVTLYTLDGTSLTAYTDMTPLTPYEIQEFNNMLSAYTTAIKLAEPTSSYNCHSYAWYPNYSNYWINYPYEFIADSHTQSISSSDIQGGDIVVYYDSSGTAVHSGYVVLTAPVTVESKWGAGPLVDHHLFDVPPEYKNNGSVDVSYFRYPDTHTYRFTPYDNMLHYISCSKCSYSTLDFHIFSSSGKCIECGYSQ